MRSPSQNCRKVVYKYWFLISCRAIERWRVLHAVTHQDSSKLSVEKS